MMMPDAHFQHDLQRQLSEQLKQSKHLGHTIQHFAKIDSTNHEAMRQAEHGAAEGVVILADQQEAGRGRLGRTWHTINDALAMSIILRPDLPPTQVPQLSLVTAVALHQALSRHCPDIRIKWPNDLLIHGAKVAGILTEMRAQPHQVEAVIVGIGINIKAPQDGWPADIHQSVTDLQCHTSTLISRLACASEIINSLDHWYDIYLQQGFAPIRQAWWDAHVASGEKVRIFDGQRYIEGIAQALDEDGALLLKREGSVQRILAGELFLT